ncbi:hypothetical protein Ahia01_000982500 [Argonauta hians]
MNQGRLAVVILGLTMWALMNLDLAYANNGTTSSNVTVASTTVAANNTGSKNVTATTEINTQSTTPNGASNLIQRGFNHIGMIVAMVVVAMISVPRFENII